MKLIIQIPCLNEEATLPATLADLPRQVAGFDTVEWLVVDDGSTDGTVAVARQGGVDHVISLPRNRGLAVAFMTGLDACLARGADVVVNTDADNQYNGHDIGALTVPILDGRADIVIGARPIATIEHFSPLKRVLQRLGSWVVRKVSGAAVADAPSGFRAISREAALRMNVLNSHTYTLETVIQAGRQGMRLMSVPVRVNGYLRPSRLIRSIPDYLRRSVGVIFWMFSIYRPMEFFLLLGALPFALGFGLGVRWLWLFLLFDTSRSHVPSLILAAILLLIGVILWALGLIAELIGVNRRIQEEIRLEARRERFSRRPDSG